MKKSYIIIIVIILIVAVIFIYLNKNSESSVCFKESCFLVEVAKTNAERERGLMFREELDQDKGMIFIFDNDGRYPFWMKNTLIPLDMIWIDKDGKVVYIKENAMPCDADPCPVIDPVANSRYVLEINGGISYANNITIGDTAQFNLRDE